MKKKDIDKCMYLDYSRGFNKALDEVEKMIEKTVFPKNLRRNINRFSKEKKVSKEFIFRESHFYRALELIEEELKQQLKEMREKWNEQRI